MNGYATVNNVSLTIIYEKSPSLEQKAENMTATTDVPIGISGIWSLNTLSTAEAFLQGSSSKPRIRISNFISNAFTSHSTSTEYLDSFDPKTGNAYAQVPVSSASEVEQALTAATDAFKSWRKTSRAVRSKYLQRIARLIEENRELLAVWESIDQGKTLDRARVEVDRAVSNFSFVFT